MKIFRKFWLTIFWIIILTFYIEGCVNVDNPNAQPIDLRTSVKFVNLTNIGTAMNVAIDSSLVINVNYSSASSYTDLPAGVRKFEFTYGGVLDTMHRAIDPYAKCTFFSVYDSSNGDANRAYIIAFERHTYAGTVAFVPQAVLVRFINLTNDTAYTGPTGAEFHVVTGPRADTVAFDTSKSDITFGTATPYYQAALSENPRYLILSGRGDTLTQATAVSSVGRYSIVLFGSSAASTLQTKVLKED